MWVGESRHMLNHITRKLGLMVHITRKLGLSALWTCRQADQRLKVILNYTRK